MQATSKAKAKAKATAEELTAVEDDTEEVEWKRMFGGSDGASEGVIEGRERGDEEKAGNTEDAD